MSFKWIWMVFVVIIAVPTAPPVVHADDTGFAYMHDTRRERGKLCMTDHWHSGSGSGPSKRAARNAAVRSWQDFTNLEYGSDWAYFRRAGSKGVRCKRTGRRSYDCNVEARPCRRR